MTTELYRVDAGAGAFLELIWPEAVRVLRREVDIDPDRLRSQLLLGEMQLWVGTENDNGIMRHVAVIFTRILYVSRVPKPKETILEIHLASGFHMERWIDSAAAKLSDYARETKVNAERLKRRKGWTAWAKRMASAFAVPVTHERDRLTVREMRRLEKLKPESPKEAECHRAPEVVMTS
jgi:hypothetical protein